jgi:hypothetical protein
VHPAQPEDITEAAIHQPDPLCGPMCARVVLVF